jgi:hypothetical protein
MTSGIERIRADVAPQLGIENVIISTAQKGQQMEKVKFVVGDGLF